MEKRTKVKLIIIATAITVAIFLSAVNASTVSYSLSPMPRANLPSAANWPSNVPNYNLKIGYFNLSAIGCEATYVYEILPLGGVPTLNLSSSNRTHQLINIFAIYEVNKIVAKPFSDTTLSISGLSIVSPQGMSGGVKFDILNGKASLSIYALPEDGLYFAMVSFPGPHNFYLNFTVTQIADLGPYKIAGKPEYMSLEWNVTVIA